MFQENPNNMNLNLNIRKKDYESLQFNVYKSLQPVKAFCKIFLCSKNNQEIWFELSRFLLKYVLFAHPLTATVFMRQPICFLIQYYQMLIYLRTADDRLLPLITFQHVLLGLISLIILKQLVRKLIKSHLTHPLPSQNHRVELQDRYYYHLGIVLVLVSMTSWNAYDFYIWLASYAAVGVFRNAVAMVLSSQKSFLQSLGFDNTIKTLLRFSSRMGFCLLAMSTAYILFALCVFSHSSTPLGTMLLYPTLRLWLDSLHLFARSQTTLKELPYFYNNNIDGVSPISNYGFFHNASSSLIKIIHFGVLAGMIPALYEDLWFVVYAPWIAVVGWEFYQALKQLGKCLAMYYEFKWLARKTDESFPKIFGSKLDICPVCREQLINYRRIQCGHDFHFKCIFRWLLNSSDNECPICRSEVLRSRNQHRCSFVKQYY